MNTLQIACTEHIVMVTQKKTIYLKANNTVNADATAYDMSEHGGGKKRKHKDAATNKDEKCSQRAKTNAMNNETCMITIKAKKTSRATGKNELNVVLTACNSDNNDMCPITLEPMNESSLSFLPDGALLFRDYPDLKR